MNESSKNDLVSAWIQLQRLPQDSSEASSLMWAAEDFNLMSITSPDECWQIILMVIEQTDDDWVLTNLAAGPLENLLAMHSDQAIEWIEGEVKKNSRLRDILDGVWKNLIPDDVWSRLTKLMRAQR